ncbi:MAG: RodZ domain-containing protein [Candidatus Korobacteraceae bacterium]
MIPQAIRVDYEAGESVGSFGERLRREREMRGVSLEQIVATTKIGRRLLLALEEEQFDLLPGGIFNKSYVKAYAKCVGIDEDEAVAEYMKAANETPPDTRVIAQQHASIHSNRPMQRAGFPVLPVLILVVVIAGGIGGWKVYQDRQNDREKRAAMPASPEVSPQPANAPASAPVASVAGSAPDQTSSAQPSQKTAAAAEPTSSTAAAVVPPPATPATTKVSPENSAATPPAGSPFEVVIRPKDSAWVSVKSDGSYVVRGIIRPPDVKTIHASSQVVFYTGNAGAVEVSFNGKNVPLTGGPNAEQVLVFDSRGVVPAARSKPPAP